MARFLYKRSDAITVHSEGNRKHIVCKGAPSSKVHTVNNWIDFEAIRPAEKSNDFRIAHQLGDAFVVSYAGIMGFAQDLDGVVKAASLLKNQSDILFLLVGDGVTKKKLEAYVLEVGLTNVKFLPMQPADKYNQLLTNSNTCLVSLRKELATPVVPGKLQSIMAAGRPAICSMSRHSDAVQLIEEANCGIYVEPGNPQALAEAILFLYENPSLAEELGRNGRVYAWQHFQKDDCIRQYNSILMP